MNGIYILFEWNLRTFQMPWCIAYNVQTFKTHWNFIDYAVNRFWIWFELNHAARQVALESNLNRIWMKFKAVLGVGRMSNWRPFQNVFKSHWNKSLNGRAIVFNFCRGFYMKYECITNHSKNLNAILKKICKVFKWNLNLNGIWMRYEWIVNGKCFFEWNINEKQLFKWKLN